MKQTLEGISFMEKKRLAKLCIDEGYSVEWSPQNNMMGIYIETGMFSKIMAIALLGERQKGHLENGFIEELIITDSRFNNPIFVYPGGKEKDLTINVHAQKLYNDVRRIFA